MVEIRTLTSQPFFSFTGTDQTNVGSIPKQKDDLVGLLY